MVDFRITYTLSMHSPPLYPPYPPQAVGKASGARAGGRVGGIGIIGVESLSHSRTALMLRVGGLPPSTDELRRQKITEMRHLFYEAYLEHYTQICSVSRETITQWEPSVAAARLSEGIDNNEKTELLEIIKASFG